MNDLIDAENKARGIKRNGTFTIIGFVILIAIYMLLGGYKACGNTSKQVQIRSVSEQETRMAVATPNTVIDLSYAGIIDKRAAMSSEQWVSYSNSLSGKRVHWSGYVIAPIEYQKYSYLTVSVSPVSDKSMPIIVGIPIRKEDGAKYPEYQEITWEGDILYITTATHSEVILFENVVITK